MQIVDAATMIREAVTPGAATQRGARQNAQQSDEDPEKCMRRCRAALKSAERMWKIAAVVCAVDPWRAACVSAVIAAIAADAYASSVCSRCR